jgi:glycosyltransferase involved in cell wall biosynthesis
VKVAFVYPNSRRQLAEDVAAGRGADSFLLGQNHLPDLGYETMIHEPRLMASGRTGGIVHRVGWLTREVVLPWELEDADVVFTALFNIVPLAARIRRRPHVVVFDFQLATVFDRSSPVRRRLLAGSLRSAAAIVCLSEFQRERLLARVSLDPARAYVCRLGIDHEFFRPEPGVTDDGYILVVGKDLARDYVTLAEAARGLDARFVLVTEERNVRGTSLPANVEVVRNLPYRDLVGLYDRARCVALTVRRPDFKFGTESGGLTALLEAMAMAKPVVVSDRPIFAEYAIPGESALLVPPEDPASLRAALGTLLDDPELARRLGARGRSLVEERFTMEHFTAGLARVIGDLTGVAPAAQA